MKPSLDHIFPTGVVGVIRASDPEAAFAACSAAIEGGVTTVEVTTSVPDHLSVVRRLVALGGPVGVGTVMDAAGVHAAAAAGAAFVVTPVVLPEVAAACRETGLLSVIGALTPTEIHSAHAAGSDLVKVFPISAAGGAAYVRLLAGPLPHIRLWVSGGVEIEDVAGYLAAGVRAVGLTTALFPPALVAGGDWAGIRKLALAASAAGRPATAQSR